jgi:hypothetical protein
LLGEPQRAKEVGAGRTKRKKLNFAIRRKKETRATFIVNEDLLEKMKSLAYWDRVLIKDIVNTAFESTLHARKKKDRLSKCRLSNGNLNLKPEFFDV